MHTISVWAIMAHYSHGSLQLPMFLVLSRMLACLRSLFVYMAFVCSARLCGVFLHFSFWYALWMLDSPTFFPHYIFPIFVALLCLSRLFLAFSCLFCFRIALWVLDSPSLLSLYFPYVFPKMCIWLIASIILWVFDFLGLLFSLYFPKMYCTCLLKEIVSYFLLFSICFVRVRFS